MKILLLNPPFKTKKGKYSTWSRSPAITKSGTVYYPIYLATATGLLEQKGHDVRLIDACAGQIPIWNVIVDLNDFKPELIVINTTTPSIYNDIDVGHEIKKKFKKATLVFVGTHVSAVPEETFQLLNDDDLIAIGEYEYTILELATGKKYKEIEGLCYKEKGKVKRTENRKPIPTPYLDLLPFVTSIYKKHLNINNYFFGAAQYPMVQIITSRGCPNYCTFCNMPQTLHGRKFRQRSPHSVFLEFEYIKKYLPEVKEVGIEDDTFIIEPDWVKYFCNLLINKNNNLPWYCNVRANMKLELLPLMKEAGCKLVTVGFESGNQTILNNIKKGITIKQIKEFTKAAKKAHILVHAAWMVGNIGETKETMEETLRLAKELNTDMAQFFPVMLYPGTFSYNWAKEKGYLTETDYSKWLDEDGQYNCLLNTPEISAEELVAFCDRALKEYYTRPKYITMKTLQGIKNPQEFKRNIKSAKELFKNLRRKN